MLVKDVAMNPKDVEGWYYLGLVRGELRNWEGMIEAFDSCSKVSNVHDKDIDQVRLHYWIESYNTGTKALQSAATDTTQYDSSIVLFKSAILLEPDSSMSYKALAYAYLNKGDQDSAIAPLSTMWDRTKDEDAAKYLGEIYYQDGEKLMQEFGDENADKLSNLKNVSSIEKGQKKVEVSATLGQPDEKTSLEPAKKKKGKRGSSENTDEKEKWVYKKYGLTLIFTGENLTEKDTDFAYNPGIDSSKYQLALAKFQKAIDVLKPAMKEYPDDQSLTSVMTNCYIASDKTQEAIELFKEASEKNPGVPDFQYNYGVILLKGGDYERAAAQFEKAIAASSSSLDDITRDLASAVATNDSAKIKEDVDDSTRTAITQWNSMYNLGAAYVNWGVDIQSKAGEKSDPDSLRKVVSAKFQEGLPYLEKYSTYKSDDPNLWELMAKVYAYTNDVKKAQAAIEKADSLRRAH